MLKKLILGKNKLFLSKSELKNWFIENFHKELEISLSMPIQLNPFEFLETISLTGMNLNFKIIDEIKNSFTNVQEMILC